MKFFVIGGAGFIGSHLVRLLLKKKHEVIVNDSFVTGRQSNLNGLKIKYVDNIEEGFKEAEFVFHLAGSVGNQYINNNPKIAMVNNLHTTMKVFDLAQTYQTPILYTSTSEVYGDRSGIFKEDADLKIGCPQSSVRWGYSCAKLAGEFLGLSYGIPLVIIRPFNIVGPRQLPDYGMVVPTFISKALKNEDIIVHGDGGQTRCFCYVGEAVVAMYKLILDKKCYGEIFNVGNMHNSISMLDLAQMIKKLTNSKSNILTRPHNEWFSRNQSDVRHRSPLVTKIFKYIKWDAEKDMEYIIKKCIYKL